MTSIPLMHRVDGRYVFCQWCGKMLTASDIGYYCHDDCWKEFLSTYYKLHNEYVTTKRITDTGMATLIQNTREFFHAKRKSFKKILVVDIK